MEDTRERAYKFVAYSAVTFSLVAILSVCITMPMVYNFVNHVQQQTKRDLQYCKVEAVYSFFFACTALQRFTFAVVGA